jgi:hypothetical protein
MKSQNEDIVGYVIETFFLQSCMQDIAESVKITVRVMSNKISQLWMNSSQHLGRFLESNSKWLEEKVNFPHKGYQAMPSSSQRVIARVGHPTKPFMESSSKRKMRKIILSLHAPNVKELRYAAQIVLRATGKRNLANIVNVVTEGIICKYIDHCNKKFKPIMHYHSLINFV